MAANTASAIRDQERSFSSRWLAGPGQNVGPAERTFSLLGGGLLAAYGLSRGTTNGLLIGALGGVLAYRGATGFCNVYQALGISTAEQRPQTAIPSGQGVRIEEHIMIRRSPAELFSFWRKLENLPQIMRHLVSVKELDSRRSHWVAKGLTGNVEWDAEIITERPNELIGWRSLPDSTVSTAGSVHFDSAPGGTEIKVNLSFNPPAGQVGAAIAWLAGVNPAREVREDLHRFKWFMEAGQPVGGKTPSSAV